MSHGNFSPDLPQTTWMAENNTPDRQMILIRGFWFDDPNGKRWAAPAGYATDGTSIPRALWTLIGSPFTGDYRRAAIVHDKACVDAGSDGRARRAADKMFYHACRAGGCSIRDAIVMYLGVRIGAAWPMLSARFAEASSDDRPRIYRTTEEKRIEADFQLIAEEVLQAGETDDPDELERRTDAAVKALLIVDTSLL
jgi:hypothetical protein